MSEHRVAEKTRDFLKRTSRETGREVRIEKGLRTRIGGIKAAFDPDRKHIIIRIREDFEEDDASIQNSIVHEAIHGLLHYGRGYCYPEPRFPPTHMEKESGNILISMVDDIVVNKIMQDEGFPPIGNVYLRMVKKETKAAEESTDIYQNVSYDPTVKRRFMVYRFIMAWGYLEYYEVTRKERKTLERFLETFEEAYPDVFNMARDVVDVLSQNDVFTSKGHHQAMVEILRLWDLDNLIVLRFYS